MQQSVKSLKIIQIFTMEITQKLKS